jgi:hypothetical protein
MQPKLTPQLINAAIEGFETQKHWIEDQIAELRAMLTGSAETSTTPEASVRKRKKFSATARRKMAVAQKATWAKLRERS